MKTLEKFDISSACRKSLSSEILLLQKVQFKNNGHLLFLGKTSHRPSLGHRLCDDDTVCAKLGAQLYQAAAWHIVGLTNPYADIFLDGIDDPKLYQYSSRLGDDIALLFDRGNRLNQSLS